MSHVRGASPAVAEHACCAATPARVCARARQRQPNPLGQTAALSGAPQRKTMPLKPLHTCAQAGCEGMQGNLVQRRDDVQHLRLGQLMLPCPPPGFQPVGRLLRVPLEVGCICPQNGA